MPGVGRFDVASSVGLDRSTKEPTRHEQRTIIPNRLIGPAPRSAAWMERGSMQVKDDLFELRRHVGRMRN